MLVGNDPGADQDRAAHWEEIGDNFTRESTLKTLLQYLAPFLLVAALFAQPLIQIQPLPLRPEGGRPKTDDAILADRARRAEMMGDYERALNLWKELLTRSPWNGEAVPAVPRLLMALRRVDEAESVVQDMLQRSQFRAQPPSLFGDPTSSFSLSLILGEVALVRGDSVKAWTLWNQSLAENNRHPEAVRALVTLLQRERRWEDSENLIRDYRQESKQPAFMAFELAHSLRGQMNYVAATEELLLYAKATPSAWEVSLNSLNQFPDDSAVTNKARGVLRKALQKDRKDAVLWRIHAGFEHKNGNAKESLNATIVADSLLQNNGLLVLQASLALLNEGEVELAHQGFQRVLAGKAQPDAAARAELGLARCLEALGHWNEAKRAYETFIEQHSTFKEADEARFHIGEILLNRDHNPDSALTVFKLLWSRGKGSSRAVMGLRIGDCHAWAGRFDEAISGWSEVVRLSGTNLGEDATQALLRIARANFWRDSTSKALAVLDSILATNPIHTAFNDAVQYSSFLGEGGFYRSQRAFAEGDYASFRRDDSLAAERFREAADLLKAGRMAEWARYSQALSLRLMGKPQEAIAILDTFILDYRESVDLDRAKYTRAVIRMDDLHEHAGALADFQNFLIDHPRSIYLEQARRRARQLDARVYQAKMKKEGA